MISILSTLHFYKKMTPFQCADDNKISNIDKHIYICIFAVSETRKICQLRTTLLRLTLFA
jgi:hypothetical protein